MFDLILRFAKVAPQFLTYAKQTGDVLARPGVSTASLEVGAIAREDGGID
jgi:hypothetical protein